VVDRVEREIEEILAKLDDLPDGPERKPISILAQREKRKPGRAHRTHASTRRRSSSGGLAP
jgi:hypothetical protein